MNESDDLSGRLYEAAFRPELWEPLLHDIAELVDAEGTVICNFRGTDSQWVASPGVASLYQDFFEGGWAFANAKSEALLSIPHQGFLCDAHHLSDAWMAEQAIYRDFYWPRGFGYALGTTVLVPSGELIGVSVEKRRGEPPATMEDLGKLDALRPHLARTAMLAARLEFARVEAGIGMLQTVGLPAAALRADGRVIATNGLFERLATQIRVEAQDRLRFADPGAHRQFADVLARRRSPGHQRLGRSFPLPRAADARPAVAHLLPVLRSARDLFAAIDILLVVTALRAGMPPDSTILQGLFDLTPTEAKVAGALCDGRAIREIAEGFGVGQETVRSHVKAILGKSGLRRQIDFVSLVAGMPRAAGP